MQQRTDSDERWMIIPGTDDCYEVSHRGRVWSRPRLGTRGGIMAGSTDPCGYRQVQLHCHGKMSNFRIHQLVALAFLGPTPEGLEVCHKDGDQLNNDVSNLKFDTHRKNTQERVEHGHHYQTLKTHCPKGHPYEGDNVRWRSNGGRTCVACERERHQRPAELALEVARLEVLNAELRAEIAALRSGTPPEGALF